MKAIGLISLLLIFSSCAKDNTLEILQSINDERLIELEERVKERGNFKSDVFWLENAKRMKSIIRNVKNDQLVNSGVLEAINGLGLNNHEKKLLIKMLNRNDDSRELFFNEFLFFVLNKVSLRAFSLDYVSPFAISSGDSTIILLAGFSAYYSPIIRLNEEAQKERFDLEGHYSLFSLNDPRRLALKPVGEYLMPTSTGDTTLTILQLK